MNAYRKFSQLCTKVLSVIAIATVVAMLIIMLIEVVRRYFFGVTFPWSDEIIRILLLYCAYFGGAVAYSKHALVCFDLLTNSLPRFVQSVLQLVNNVIINVFFVFLIWQTIRKINSPSVTQNVSTATGLSGAVPYVGILVGLVFLTIFTIGFYPELIANLRKDSRKENGQ